MFHIDIVLCCRLSSLGLSWDKDPDYSDLPSIRAGRASPSSSSYSPILSPRYASYSPSTLPPSSSASSYRRNSTIDLPMLRQGSNHHLPPPAIRRSSTMDRHQDYSRAGSVSRNTDVESRAISPNYSRFSSTLDDTKDWGFSTLRRRNSRSGLAPRPTPNFPNDDIRF